jgi:putative methionine-R-sulfoxide reductase with GAF domain
MLISRVADGGALYVNQAMADLVHSTVDDLMAQTTLDFYRNPQDRQRVLHGLKTDGRIDNFELELVRQGGEPFWGLLSARTLVFEDEAAIISSVYEISSQKRVEEMLTKRASELTTVAQISTAVATLTNPQEMLQTVVDLVQERFEFYHAHIYLFDEQQGMLILSAGAGAVGRQMCAEAHAISLQKTQSLVARAARNKQGVIVNDVQKDDDFLPHPLLPETRSEMAVPMVSGDQCPRRARYSVEPGQWFFQSGCADSNHPGRSGQRGAAKCTYAGRNRAGSFRIG